MKVGVTGQSGFIGSHLINYLKFKQSIEIIPFEKKYFESDKTFERFLLKCDVVVHLAGMNRGPDAEIYDINVRLAERLVTSLERISHKPHVIFSSSTHENKDAPYGRSKHDSRLILFNWARRNGAKFTGMIIPNVYGPFCKPFYNSVVASFCYQLTHGLEPEIHVDQSIGLLYIDELVQTIYEVIKNGHDAEKIHVPSTREIMVSELLSKLRYFKEKYFEEKIVPDLTDSFDLSLFNVFRSYIEHNYFPVPYNLKKDDRGHLFEVIRSLNQGQAFFSSTKSHIERGNHYHRRKLERFSIIKGKALIQMRRLGTDEIIEYTLNGDIPTYVDIPILYTHNLVNIGEEELLMLFWTSELFNPDDSDTYYEKVIAVRGSQ